MFTKGFSKNEWLWVCLASLLLVLVSSLPYLAAYLAETPDKIFCGVVYDRMDYAVHLGTMRQGWQGEWKYTFQFTSEDQAGAYVKQAYLFLGHVSRWLGLDLRVGYQLGRIMLGFLSGLAVYGLTANLFERQAVRWSVWLLVMLGSGLGWLQLLIGWYPDPEISPIDFWLIDAYPLFGMLIFPHFSALLALMAGMVSGFLSWLERPVMWKLALVGLCAVGLQLIQPYAPLVSDLLIASLLVLRWFQKRRINPRELAGGVFIALIQLPLFTYQLRIFRANEIFQLFAAQNITRSPPIVYYFLGFGILWLLAGLGAGSLRNKFDPTLAAFLAWVIFVLLLVYSPGNLQRRFIFGYTLPLGILAGYGIQQFILPWWESPAPGRLWQARKLISIPVALFMFSSSLYLIAGTSFYMAQRPDRYFDSKQLVQAVDWIATAAQPGDIVLAAPLTSQLVVVRTSMRVFVGHPIETVHYAEKLELAAALYSGSRGDDDWLAQEGIDWIIAGPHERELGYGEIISSDIEVAYSIGSVQVYRGY